MPRKLIVVVDILARDVTGPVLYFHHDAPAIRFFTDAIQDPSTPLNKHPEDYELHELGLLDDDLHITLTGRTVTTGAQVLEQLRRIEEKQSLQGVLPIGQVTNG